MLCFFSFPLYPEVRITPPVPCLFFFPGKPLRFFLQPLVVHRPSTSRCVVHHTLLSVKDLPFPDPEARSVLFSMLFSLLCPSPKGRWATLCPKGSQRELGNPTPFGRRAQPLGPFVQGSFCSRCVHITFRLQEEPQGYKHAQPVACHWKKAQQKAIRAAYASCSTPKDKQCPLGKGHRMGLQSTKRIKKLTGCAFAA